MSRHYYGSRLESNVPKNRMYRVFISHAAEDEEIARSVRKSLDMPGIEVFMFEGNIPTGDQFAEEIRNQLENCDEFCLLWTENSSSSQWVLFETGGAHALRCHISPVLDQGIKPSNLPEALRLHQCCFVYQLPYYAEQVLSRAQKAAATEHLMDFQPRRFIAGRYTQGDWQVISHCDDAKWRSNGFAHAPGKELYRGLMSYGPHVDLVTLLDSADNSKSTLSNLIKRYADAVFLIDSPRSNPLVRYVIENYRRFVSIGGIRFELKTDGQSYFDYEEIALQDGRNLKSDKYKAVSTQKCLVGSYKDYFVVFRLPGSILGMDSPDAKLWVICGIHAKGTWGAVQLFSNRNLKVFADMIMKESYDNAIPDYFEAVYEVPNHIDVAKENAIPFSLVPVHFAILLSRDREAVSDGMDARLLPLFVSPKKQVEIPILIAHIDLVAGCNHACPGCIESELREQKERMSLALCMEILCTLKKYGCKKIGFYGGEPTLHPNFPCILQIASQMGFDITLVTNGTRLHTPELKRALIDSMDAFSPPQVRISVDADIEETYASVHGINPGTTLEIIKKAARELIRENGIPISISYRLVPKASKLVKDEGNIFEAMDSCRFWKKLGARQFSLRPMTAAGGVEPLPLSGEELGVLERIQEDKELAGFISMPAWLRHEPLTSKNPPEPKEYETCYSALYRIVISPRRRTQSDGTDFHPGNFSETDEAWISLCSYRRLDERFGCPFPKDFGSWMIDKRISDIKRINPKMQCENVLCCRHSYNQTAFSYVNRE